MSLATRGFASNRKGGLLDIILFMLVLFIMGIVTVVGGVVLNDFNDRVQTSMLSNSTKQVTSEASGRFISLFDGIFLFAFVMLWAGVVIGVYLIDTNPAFFIFSVIILMFLIFVAAVISNVFQQFNSVPQISAFSSGFVIIPFLLNYWPLVMVVMGFSVLVALYTRGGSA